MDAGWQMDTELETVSLDRDLLTTQPPVNFFTKYPCSSLCAPKREGPGPGIQ
jgi:hypothetical protein